MTLLAHKDADGGVQTLRDHLHNAGDLAESYESEFSQIPRMAALLHDVGKVAQQFQTYLISGKGRRGEIPHARQGAFVVNDLPISNSAAEIVKEILELVNEKHAISIASEDFDICVLNGDYYKGEYGVVTETDMSLLMI